MWKIVDHNFILEFSWLIRGNNSPVIAKKNHYVTEKFAAQNAVNS